MNISSFVNFFKPKKKLTRKIFLLNDHKTGFKLTRKLVNLINSNAKLDIQIRSFYLFWNNYQEDNKYIIIVRHPKEIIISAYLYHKKCKEKWLLRPEGYYYQGWEKHHFEPEQVAKNKAYSDKARTFCYPIPYQEKLNTLSQNSGIIYEMNAVSKLTIDGMYNLEHYQKPNTMMIRFEDLVFNHDDTIEQLCGFLEIRKRRTPKILRESLQHNLLNQKKKNQITKHSTNVNVVKDRYKQYWNETIEAEFNQLFPTDILSKFGYE